MTQALRQSERNARPAAELRAARVGVWAGIDLTGAPCAGSSSPRSAATGARAMARLFHGRGLDLLVDAASPQRVVIDLCSLSMTASHAVDVLQEIGLRVRWAAVSEAATAADALLVDTTRLDARGLDESGARQLAGAIADRLQYPGDKAVALRVKRQVRAVADRLALVEAAGRGR